MKFHFRKRFCVFEQNYHKRVSPVKNRERKHHHLILHIRICLGTKLKLKLTIFIFFTKFAQIGYFRSNTQKKVNTSIEFYIFELVWVPNFTFNWQFCFVDQICRQMVFSRLALEKYSIQSNNDNAKPSPV